MKKLKIFTALICFMTALCFSTYAAASPPCFKITPTADTVRLNDTVYLLVDLENNDGFGANQFRITYAQDKLLPESVTLGELIPSDAITSINTNTAGEINFSLISVRNITGNGTVLVVQFKAINTGNASFGFKLLAYADSDGTSLDAAYSTAEIKIEAENADSISDDTSANGGVSHGSSGSTADTKKDETKQAPEQQTENVPNSQTPDKISFADVDESHWAYNEICKTAELGLFGGTGGNMFSPELPMTRAMFVTVLHRYAGKPQSVKAAFSDIKEDWYADAVSWAAENGIVSGTGNNEFSPDRYITRGEISAILCRFKNGKCTDVNSVNTFKDSDTIPEWGRESIAWAVEQKIITGRSGGTVAFSDNATRAETAVMFVRFLSIK